MELAFCYLLKSPFLDHILYKKHGLWFRLDVILTLYNIGTLNIEGIKFNEGK